MTTAPAVEQLGIMEVLLQIREELSNIRVEQSNFREELSSFREELSSFREEQRNIREELRNLASGVGPIEALAANSSHMLLVCFTKVRKLLVSVKVVPQQLLSCKLTTMSPLICKVLFRKLPFAAVQPHDLCFADKSGAHHPRCCKRRQMYSTWSLCSYLMMLLPLLRPSLSRAACEAPRVSTVTS